MQLHEANARLKTPITEEQLDSVHTLYRLLNFMDKDDFCKIIDAVGIEKLVEGGDTYDRLFRGKQLLVRVDKFIKAWEDEHALEKELEECDEEVLHSKILK